jgi:VanZ family protein
MQKIFQATSWFLIFTIVALSLCPPSIRPVTDLPHQVEHLLIFLATGTAAGLGYPRQLWFITLTLVTFTGLIEIAQMWIPERHARLSDFLVDTAAACLGIGTAYLLRKSAMALRVGPL